MTKQVRDWHKEQQEFMAVDGKRIEEDAECIIISLEGFHGLLADKERADKLQMQLDAVSGLCRAETKRADRWREHVLKLNSEIASSEAREKNQQAAIKEALDTWEAMDPFDDPLDTVEKMINLLRPFYPKDKEGIKE